MSGARSDPVYAGPAPGGHAYCSRPTQYPKPQPIMAIDDAVRSEGEWTQIIRGEFLEIPGLRLTVDQIQTLWGLHCDVCAAVLEDLLHQRFLQLTADGHYVRGASCAGSRQAAGQSGSYHGEASVSVR
jgi:hypothetical protein